MNGIRLPHPCLVRGVREGKTRQLGVSWPYVAGKGNCAAYFFNQRRPHLTS